MSYLNISAVPNRYIISENQLCYKSMGALHQKGIKVTQKMLYSIIMSKRLYGFLRYLIPSAITMLIYSIILAVKGIYPFGNNTID